MRRGFAITIVYLGLLMVPVGIGALIVPPIVTGAEDLADNAPAYADDVTEFVNENERLQRAQRRLRHHRQAAGGGGEAARRSSATRRAS